jgi:hypothetical protein
MDRVGLAGLPDRRNGNAASDDCDTSAVITPTRCRDAEFTRLRLIKIAARGVDGAARIRLWLAPCSPGRSDLQIARRSLRRRGPCARRANVTATPNVVVPQPPALNPPIAISLIQVATHRVGDVVPPQRHELGG